MKKNIMKVALAAAIVTVAGYGMYENQTKETMSDVMLENVEALADCESSDNYTGARKYYTIQRCICLSCPEPGDTNCKCLRGE